MQWTLEGFIALWLMHGSLPDEGREKSDYLIKIIRASYQQVQGLSHQADLCGKVAYPDPKR
jgi:hypothetical protein